MQMTETHERVRGNDLQTPERNRYYYGKKLEVAHFDIEQDYFNYKRALINRHVLGYGVVCGLDVSLEKNVATVRSGFLIDKRGREIIVPVDREIDLPQPPQQKQQDKPQQYDDDCGIDYHLVICYHECGTAPEAGIGDDCGEVICVNSLVQERYRLEWRRGKAPERHHDACIHDLIKDGKINRNLLVEKVSRGCPAFCGDGCLPLANLSFPRNEKDGEPHIDITVRPIVYTNDLLFELLCAALAAGRHDVPRVGK